MNPANALKIRMRSLPTLTTEIVVATFALLWARWLFGHPQLFDTMPAYSRLVEHGADESSYAFRAMIIGLIQFMTMLAGRCMWIPAMCGVGLWSYLALEVHHGNPMGAGWISFASFALGNLLITMTSARRRSFWATWRGRSHG